MRSKFLQQVSRPNINKSKSSANTFHRSTLAIEPVSKISYCDSPFTYNTAEAFLGTVPKNQYLCYWAANASKKRRKINEHISQNKKKHSLIFLGRQLNTSSEFKKDCSNSKIGLSQPSKKTNDNNLKCQTKVLPSRLDTIVHPQENISFHNNINQFGRNFRSQKEISHQSTSSKRNFQHIFSQKKINKNQNYLIRSQNKTYDLKQNALKSQQKNNYPNMGSLTKTSICFIKENRNNTQPTLQKQYNQFSAPRIRSNQNCGTQTNKKINDEAHYQIEDINDVSIDIKIGDNSCQICQQEESLGFGCSVIEETPIKNDSDFLNTSQKQLFTQISPSKDKTRKRTWKKLPVDFLKARY